MSTKDFRARQLRTNQIINSGSSLTSPLLIYGLGSATNDSGGFKTSDFVTGSNTWLYISGAVGSGLPGSTEQGLVTFGGDLYISGNIYGGGIGGGGTPGGITTSVQFNDGSGNFGGDSDLTWQKTSNILTLTGSLLTTGIAQFAGGYGSSGVTISPIGNISTDGDLTVDGITALNGNTVITGALLTTAFAQFAGGYGSAGVTIANNGDFFTNGNAVIDGTALITNNTTITGSLFTNGPAQFADGYGSSGVTIFNNGNIFTDGELRVEGITTLKGNSIFGDSPADTIAVNARITSSIVPTHNVTWNLGSPTLRWANIYTGDLHLQNDRGDWTIVEEKDFLCVVNNKSGKKFKMMLEPID
jgi:hypothetical protein